MAESYLMDTSAVIKYLNGSLTEEGINFIEEVVDDNYVISFITEIELQVWDAPNKEDLAIYQIFAEQAEILALIRRSYRRPYASGVPTALNFLTH